MSAFQWHFLDNGISWPELVGADLSFTTFVKVVELQLLDMNTPDAEPCDFAVRRPDGRFTSVAYAAACVGRGQDFLEALQDLRTSQSDLEESQTEWTELYGPPLDDHKMDIDGVSVFVPSPSKSAALTEGAADDPNTGSTHQPVGRRIERGVPKM